jgi:hypothetical protein
MSTKERPTVEDILGSGFAEFKKAYDEADAADSFPIPAGRYEALVADGRLAKAQRNGTPSLKLTFEIQEPEEFRGRKIWHDIWLTTKAAYIAKKDLAKLGIGSLDRLQDPLPVGLIMSLNVSLETTDKGGEYNKVVSFKRSTEGNPDGRSPRALPGNSSSAVHHPVEGDDIPF